MKSRLLPLVERLGRFALNRQGFESRSVATAVAELHAYDARGSGDLPTTVILHGIGSGATSFAATLTRLRPHVGRLVAPDLPGHGFSQPPATRLTPQALFDSARAALDHLVDEPMVLVGNSLGGALAIRYAIENPPRVRGLVLASPAAARTSEADWRGLTSSFTIDSVADARRMLGRFYHRAPFYLPAFAPGFRDVMNRRAVRDILESSTVNDLPTPEQLAGLSMPVLFLWGKSERVLPPGSLDYFRRHLPPHAVVEEPVGFGHCPHVDDPPRLAARIVEFARQTVATSRP